jgi:hypothetical protein
MNKIPSNRVRSHADFDSTPLGKWATDHDATATPAGRQAQRLNDIPNPFLSNGLDEVRGSGRSA